MRLTTIPAHDNHYIPLDPSSYEKKTFRNCGGTLLSSIETSLAEDLLDLTDVSVVLDVGMGPGRFVRNLAKNKRLVVGIDRNADMIKHFKNISRTNSNVDNKTHFVVADGQYLPFRASCFDAVICVRVLKYFKKPDRGIAEFSSILKPGGKLIIEFPNILNVGTLFQLPQYVVHGEFYPRILSLSRMKYWLTNCELKTDRVVSLYRIPPKIWTLAHSNFAAQTLFLVETLFQRIMPPELLSRSIFISAVRL